VGGQSGAEADGLGWGNEKPILLNIDTVRKLKYWWLKKVPVTSH